MMPMTPIFDVVAGVGDSDAIRETRPIPPKKIQNQFVVGTFDTGGVIMPISRIANAHALGVWFEVVPAYWVLGALPTSVPGVEFLLCVCSKGVTSTMSFHTQCWVHRIMFTMFHVARRYPVLQCHVKTRRVRTRAFYREQRTVGLP